MLVSGQGLAGAAGQGLPGRREDRRRGGLAAWTAADGTERGAPLICLVTDGSQAALAGEGGRHGQQPRSLFRPFSGCAWLPEGSRCWWEDRGAQGPRATPSPSPEETGREVQVP